jgi:hypothetical protein
MIIGLNTLNGQLKVLRVSNLAESYASCCGYSVRQQPTCILLL